MPIKAKLDKGDCFFMAGDNRHVYCALHDMPPPDLIEWPRSWAEINRRLPIYLSAIDSDHA